MSLATKPIRDNFTFASPPPENKPTTWDIFTPIFGDLEGLVTTVFSTAYGPIRDFAYYFFPSLQTRFSYSGGDWLSDETSSQAAMPLTKRKIVIQNLNELKNIAGVSKGISYYLLSNKSFESSGGTCSFGTANILLPQAQVFRQDTPCFGLEKEQSAKDLWVYTDNELRFLILREMCSIDENHGLIRLITKIFLFSCLFFAFINFALLPFIGITVASFALYIFLSRYLEMRKDKFGVQKLSTYLNQIQNIPKDRAIYEARKHAVSTFEKQRQQNIMKREEYFFDRVLISKDGNDYRSLFEPSIVDRINHIRKV